MTKHIHTNTHKHTPWCCNNLSLLRDLIWGPLTDGNYQINLLKLLRELNTAELNEHPYLKNSNQLYVVQYLCICCRQRSREGWLSWFHNIGALEPHAGRLQRNHLVRSDTTFCESLTPSESNDTLLNISLPIINNSHQKL